MHGDFESYTVFYVTLDEVVAGQHPMWLKLRKVGGDGYPVSPVPSLTQALCNEVNDSNLSSLSRRSFRLFHLRFACFYVQPEDNLVYKGDHGPELETKQGASEQAKVTQLIVKNYIPTLVQQVYNYYTPATHTSSHPLPTLNPGGPAD